GPPQRLVHLAHPVAPYRHVEPDPRDVLLEQRAVARERYGPPVRFRRLQPWGGATDEHGHPEDDRAHDERHGEDEQQLTHASIVACAAYRGDPGHPHGASGGPGTVMIVSGSLRLGARTFAPGELAVMAIINRTPDSFFDKGATFD